MKKDLIKQEQVLNELYNLVKNHQNTDECTTISKNINDGTEIRVNEKAMNQSLTKIMSIFNRDITPLQ